VVGERGRPFAEDLLKLDGMRNQRLLEQCFKVAKDGRHEAAERVLANPSTPVGAAAACVDFLGSDARDYARAQLELDEVAFQPLIIACLRALGEDAIPHARRLLRRPKLGTATAAECLRLVGELSPEDLARILADPDTRPHLVVEALRVAGEAARPHAERLLADPGVGVHVASECFKLVGDAAPEHAERLLERGGLESPLAARCLAILGPRAREHATALLEGRTPTSELAEACFQALGHEAAPHAKEILTREDAVDPDLITRCLNALPDEDRVEGVRCLVGRGLIARAKQFLGAGGRDVARLRLEVLADWRDFPWAIVAVALAAQPFAREARATAEAVMRDWDSVTDTGLRVAALRTPCDSRVRRELAERILAGWDREPRKFVAAALGAYWDDPSAVRDVCLEMLGRWRDEVLEGDDGYVGHLVKAFANPEVGAPAAEVATQIMAAHAAREGVPGHLVEVAAAALEGDLPIWSRAHAAAVPRIEIRVRAKPRAE
jgi:hypothetical protein